MASIDTQFHCIKMCIFLQISFKQKRNEKRKKRLTKDEINGTNMVFTHISVQQTIVLCVFVSFEISKQFGEGLDAIMFYSVRFLFHKLFEIRDLSRTTT